MTDIEMAEVLRDVWYEIPNSTRREIAERLEEQATELTQMLTALDGSADLIENLKAEVERLTLTVRKLQGHQGALEADNLRLNDALRQAVLDAAEWARKAGEAQGKLEISEAAVILDGWMRDCKRLEADNARLREAMKGPLAWLERWAVHVGNCKGDSACTCGLTFVQHELCAALQETSHDA